jgi:hypothetical protein
MKIFDITQSELKAAFDYNPDTGEFVFKPKPLVKTYDNRWNLRYAGKVAGCISRGYLVIIHKNAHFQAHRLAWLYVYGYTPDIIDHINHNGLDNRIYNLREVDRKENPKNKSMPEDHKHGVFGIAKKYHRWLAYIKVSRKKVHIGSFEDWFEAVCARKSAENRYGFHANHGLTLKNGIPDHPRD